MIKWVRSNLTILILEKLTEMEIKKIVIFKVRRVTGLMIEIWKVIDLSGEQVNDGLISVCYLFVLNQINKTMIGPFVRTQQHAIQAKNAKILQRKQIEKRLQGLTASQYEKIVSNLTAQNEKLKNEVSVLTKKVQELMESRKMTKNKNPQIEQEVARLKKELDLKYESMSYLKESVKKLGQSDMTEQMKLKIKEHNNMVSKCEKQFRELQIQKGRTLEQISKNEEDLKEFVEVSDPDGRMESLKSQNKELKQKINALKQKLTVQQKSSKQTISKLYELKDEEKKGLTKDSKQISMSLRQIKATSLSEISQLQKQIQSLKTKKKEAEKDLVTDKIIKEAKRGKLQKQIRDSLEFQKQLYKRRVKVLNQLNLYEQKQIQYRHHFQKEAQAGKKEFQNEEAQTIEVIPLEFRKEWIGKGQGMPFNDAEILQYRGHTLIKGVTVYKTPESIVFTKFHYESPQKKKYESEPPFQKFVLKKCESKKYESKTAAPLCGLIVSVHAASKRVVRIEFKWGDGQSSVIGWDIEGSTKYPFDISQNQRPICMFGTINTVAKFSYVLQSLGCEINGVDD